MHVVELERKLRLPEPLKALEKIRKLFKGTGQQQLEGLTGKASTTTKTTGEILLTKKRARIEAERHRGRGIGNPLRTTMR